MTKEVKKTVRKKVVVSNGVGEEPSPTPLAFDEKTLTKVLHLDAEVRAAKSELSLRSLVLETTVQRVDPQDVIRTLTTQVRQLAQEATSRQLEYDAFMASVGERMGLDMTEYTYDDRSGVLHRVKDASGQEDGASSQSSE